MGKDVSKKFKEMLFRKQTCRPGFPVRDVADFLWVFLVREFG